MQDLRYALRTLRNSPGFTLTSLTVLALAIGVNTAMFSVLNAVLLRPLPFRAPQQLAMLWSEIPSQNIHEGRTGYADIEQWRRQNSTFTDMAFCDPVSATLVIAGESHHISVSRVSPNIFPLLGIQVLHGRSFSPLEAERRERVAVISHSFWQRWLGGSPDAVGRSIEIDGLTSQVIGVLPPGFQLPFLAADMLEPHTLFPDWQARRSSKGAGSWFVLGRLGPAVTVEQAQAEMNAIARRLDENLPIPGQMRGISVVPLSAQLTGPTTRLALWLLTGAVLSVLLIAATNVASLALARSVSREREIGIRAALGAARGRIIRQLLAESLTLATISGVAGLAVAQMILRIILALKPSDLARLNEVSLDVHVLAAAFGFCLLTGVLVGLTPAVAAARRNLTPASREGGRGVTGGLGTRRIRRALVVTEFALAIVLLFAAGLLVRSLWSIENIDPGFRPERVLSMQLASPTFEVTAHRSDFYSRLLEEVESLPGIESAAIISDLFVGGSPERILIVEGNAGNATERLRFRSDETSAGFFKTVGTRLVRGRFFSFADGRESSRVAIVNEAMVRRLWPGVDPIGRRFKFGPALGDTPWFTVVGVVADMRRQGLEKAPIPQIFEPIAQNPPRLATLLVRTSNDKPMLMAEAVGAAVRRVEKQVPLYGITTLEARLGLCLAERRFQTALLLAFSAAALLMAAIGIYGLVQYSIASRTHEIGIRMAIGAKSGEIFRMVIREGLELSLTGLTLGLVGAIWVGNAASSLLFGVSGTDPLTLASVTLLLTAAALAACYFPARRAMKVEPIVALRQE